MELIKLDAQVRARKGSRESRKLRFTGFVPAVVYGHKQDSMPLAVPRAALLAALKRGGRLFTLDAGGKEENAFIADLQHDALTDEILHVDFTRVDMNEEISLEVGLKFHGTAIGVVHGGLMEEIKTGVRVKCLPAAIPSHLVVEVAGVELLSALYVKDLVLPPGVAIDDNPDQMIVRVIEKVEIVEAAPAVEAAVAAALPSSPEVIGKKKEEEGEAEPAEKGKEKPEKKEKEEKKGK